MIQALQIVALLLVATAWSFAVAHVAEYPGKMRLDRAAYFKVQTIYYPGFTIGGASEPLSILALIALVSVTPAGSSFWLFFVALVASALTQAVFWLVTQPVNRVWTSELALGGSGAKFFQTGGKTGESDWTRLRDRWEQSHLVRAVLMSVALVALVVAAISN